MPLVNTKEMFKKAINQDVNENNNKNYNTL